MPIPVKVQDTLRDPIGNSLPKIMIKVVTTVGSGSVLTSAEVTHITDSNGYYDFELEAGTHNIYVKFTDTFEYIGTTIVNESVPSPVNINTLLHFSTPIQPDIVNDIYDNVYGCICCLENNINTCTTQLSCQVVQGDTGVRQEMTTYTNNCLQACSAELTTAMQSGDAQTLTQAQVYTDALGTNIACCTTALDSGLSQLCTTMTSITTQQGCAIAQACSVAQAGDASVVQQMCAYTDTCTGNVETSLSNLITACTASVSQCLSATPTFAAYQVKSAIGDVSASIGVITSQDCIDGKDFTSSCVILKGDKVVLWNGLCDASSKEVHPFVLCNDTVYMNHTMVNCLEGTCVKGASIYGANICAGTVESVNFVSCRDTSTCPAQGFCINGDTGNAEFYDVTVRGRIEGSTIRGSTIEGGVIKGSAIQSSYIASDVPILALSWANQEQYGAMDIISLCNRGITPYFGYNLGVTGNSTGVVPSIAIASYDYTDKSYYNRYTRRYITPYASATSHLLYKGICRTCSSSYPNSPPWPWPGSEPDNGVNIGFYLQNTGTDIRIDSGLIRNGQSTTRVVGNTCIVFGASMYTVRCNACKSCYDPRRGARCYDYWSWYETGYHVTVDVRKHDYCANVAAFWTCLFLNGLPYTHNLCDVANNTTTPTDGGP